MPIYAFVQSKGGVGKSTAALCVAYSGAFKRRYGTMALVELDVQGTLTGWHSARKANGRGENDHVSFLALHDTRPDSVRGELAKLAAAHEVLILDCAGESEAAFQTRLGVAIADLAVIPMRTTGPDEAAFRAHMVPLLEGHEGRCAVLATFTHPRTRIERLVEYVEAVTGLSCLRAALPSRSVYEHFGRRGLTLGEYRKSVAGNVRAHDQAAKAVQDVERIAQEILRRVDTQRKNDEGSTEGPH